MNRFCPNCGASIEGAPARFCPSCSACLQRFERVLITTAPSLEGYKITETIEVIAAECVLGMNLFRDFFAGIRDIIGGRSEATQTILRDARNACLLELREEARMMGANAVIGVKLDYSEFSGGGKSMLFLVMSGTAVRVERLAEATSGQ